MRLAPLFGLSIFALCAGGCSATYEEVEGDESTGAINKATDTGPEAKSDLRSLTSHVAKRRYLYPTEADPRLADVEGRDTRPVDGTADAAAVKADDVVRFDLPPATFKYVSLEVSGITRDSAIPVICTLDAKGMGRCAEGTPHGTDFIMSINVSRDDGVVAILVAQKPLVDAVKAGAGRSTNEETPSVWIRATWNVPKGDVVLPKKPLF